MLVASQESVELDALVGLHGHARLGLQIEARDMLFEVGRETVHSVDKRLVAEEKMRRAHDNRRLDTLGQIEQTLAEAVACRRAESGIVLL